MIKPKVTLLIGLIFGSIMQLQAYTGEVLRSFDTPGDYPTGLTWDGEHLWLADRGSDLIYCISPKTGKVERTIEAPAYWPNGMAFDGQNLWNADVKGGIPLSENYQGTVYQIDPASGNLLRTLNTTFTSPSGLTWDGQYLWCADNKARQIIQFDPADGTTIRSFASPASDPRGVTYDGKYLWITDRIADEIHMVDPATGSVLLIADAPGAVVRGIAFDGKHLWVVDQQTKKLYELSIRDGERYHRSNSLLSHVTLTHQFTNFGPGKVLTADAHIAIPVNRVNQELQGEIRYSKNLTDKVSDKWDQQTAHFLFKNLKNEEQAIGTMDATVRTWDVRYFIYPDECGTLSDIPQKISDRYLADNNKYQITHPVIQQAVKQVIGEEQNPYWMARKIFNHLINNLYYEMVGGWNTAPTVLERGNGSCSEYTFVFIAMCRAAGLPARYVGSVVQIDDRTSMDDEFHRWVEIYLPNYGWVPIDPSGGDQASSRDQAKSIGFIGNKYLITTQSGGGSETMEWNYNFNHFYTTQPKTHVVSEYYADWQPLDL